MVLLRKERLYMPLTLYETVKYPIHHLINRAENLPTLNEHLVKLGGISNVKRVPAYTVPFSINAPLGRVRVKKAP